MKVVLLKDLKGKGKKGDIIEANSGYAQNFLIPQGYAKAGTSSNLNEANQAKKAQEYHNEQARILALEQKKKIDNMTITLKVKCGAQGKVFGSVTNKEVAEELAKKNFDIDKKKIDISTIKTTGVFDAKIRLFPNITANIKVDVVSE